MHLEKQFDVKRARDDAAAVLDDDSVLIGLFPDTETTIVASRGSRRTTETRYRALGLEGVATFHFDRTKEGNVAFEKVCDGRVWKELRGSVTFEPRGEGTRVRIEMDGRTKALVPEFTIRTPMQQQIDEMATALKKKLSSKQR